MIRNIRYDEVIGKNKKRIFNLIGLSSKTTDYAERNTYTNNEYVLSESVLQKDTTSNYYDFDNILRENRATVITKDGTNDTRNIHNPLMGIRLSGNYSDIKDQATIVEELENGIKIVEFGEYPSILVEEIQGIKTYNLDKDKVLLETGKTYWVPALEVQLYLNPQFEPHVKYSFGEEEKEEYVELKEYVDCYGNKYAEYDGLYYLVQPVRWYVDEKEDYIVSTSIIAGGVPYGSYFQMLYPELEDTYSVDYFVENKLVQNLVPSEIYDLPEEYVLEPVEEPTPTKLNLPNLDNLSREELVALQTKIAEMLSQPINITDHILRLK